MLPSYKLVFINLIISFLLVIGLITYKFLFKRKINLFYLLIIISLLPIISIFRGGTYESGDLSLHSKIAMSFYESLKDGNLLPRWGVDLCAGYGCPDFIFIYIFPYYIISLFHFVGFSFINSVKLLLATSFILSGILMYLWAKEELGKIQSFIAGIFYLFFPYHLVNTHFRVDIAEVVSYPLLPLNFLCTKKLIETKSKKWFLLQILSLVLLILSHQAVVLSFFPFLIAYGIFIWKKTKLELKILFYYLFSIVFSLLISTFYWLPILFEKKYIMWGHHATISFPKFSEFFYSTWRYGFLFQGPIGQLSFVVGYIQWIIILIAVYLLIKKATKLKGPLVFFISSFFIIFLTMQSFSKNLWEIIPLIKNFQFTYRMLNLEALFTSILAGIVLVNFRKKWFVIFVCILAIFPTILNWGNRRTIPEIGDEYLRNELKKGDPGLGDFTMPIWTDYKNLYKIPKKTKSIEIIKGYGIISNPKLSVTTHSYDIYAKSNVTIKENTFYFPGWTLRINNKIYPVNFEYRKNPGIITFNLKKGLYKVYLSFENTPIRNLSLNISIISLFLLILYLRPKFLDKR